MTIMSINIYKTHNLWECSKIIKYPKITMKDCCYDASWTRRNCQLTLGGCGGLPPLLPGSALWGFESRELLRRLLGLKRKRTSATIIHNMAIITKLLVSDRGPDGRLVNSSMHSVSVQCDWDCRSKDRRRLMANSWLQIHSQISMLSSAMFLMN